jgi:tetratricopeptide (TPR) repeat protein
MFIRGRVLLVLPALLLVMPTIAAAKARPPKQGPKQPAPPPPNDDESAAHYQKGVEDFSAGEYDDAIVEFKLALSAGGPPALLFNIAQAHRAAGHDQEALAYYKEYLRQVPDAPNRADVEQRMGTIESELQAASQAERGIVSTPATTNVADSGKGGIDKIAGRDDATMAVDLRTRPVVRSGSMLESTPAPYHPGRALKWTGGALLASGAISMGLGIYFGKSASDAAAELDARAGRGQSWTDTESRLYDRGQLDEKLGVSLVLAGGAALVGGAVLSYLGWQRDEQAAEFACVPVRGGAQAVMAWGF